MLGTQRIIRGGGVTHTDLMGAWKNWDLELEPGANSYKGTGREK